MCTGARLHRPVQCRQGTHLVRVLLHWHRKDTTKAKVCDLEQACVRVHEKVLRLEIAVHDAMLVHEGLASDQLIEEGLHSSSITL